MTIKESGKNILLCILTGLFAVLAFPKADLFFLVWVAFIPLIYVIFKTSPKQSFFYGLLAGFVFNATGLYWLIPMLEFNTGSYVQAFIAGGLLWIYMAVYWALWSLCFNIIRKSTNKNWIVILAAPVIWVLLEFVRTYFLTGFPWMLLGYSQYKFTAIIQIAEYTGVYGISFLIILCNILFYFWLKEKQGTKFLYFAAALFLVFTVFGVIKTENFKFYGDEIFKAAIVQPNIDQYKKWDREFKNEIIQNLETQAKEISGLNADLVIWPETVLPDFIPWDKTSYDTGKAISQIAGGFNVMGSPYNDETGKLFNAVFAFKDDGKDFIAVHKKNHLVPFGEFIPFKKILSKFFGVLNQLGDFSRGKDAEVFSDGKLFLGATICSENFFPDISRRFCLNGAKVLTNHTNDAWFFDTAAPYQHFMMNVFRAVENRKAVIVSANSGISGIIDASGRIVTTTQISIGANISGEFLQNGYKSFYTVYSDIFIIVCALLLILILILIFII